MEEFWSNLDRNRDLIRNETVQDVAWLSHCKGYALQPHDRTHFNCSWTNWGDDDDADWKSALTNQTSGVTYATYSINFTQRRRFDKKPLAIKKILSRVWLIVMYFAIIDRCHNRWHHRDHNDEQRLRWVWWLCIVMTPDSSWAVS